MSESLTGVEPPLDQEAARSTQRGTGVGRFLLGKLGNALASLVLVVVLGFLLFRMIPGDPVVSMTRGRPVGPEQLAALREKLGVDKPMIVQFFDYVGGLLQGDFGTSYLFQRSVGGLLAERIWPTLLLVGTATVLAILLGLWFGIRAAWRRGSRFDKLSTGTALTLWAMPQFWLGLLLLIAFSGVFPSGGMVYSDTPPDFLSQALDVAYHLVLPCLTLTAAVYAQYLLVMRSSLLEEINADYLTTARAKGLRDDMVRRKHAVPNAMLPTVTLIFLQFGMVLSGSVAVETVYSWPGIGQLLYEGLQGPDLPVLQSTFVLMGAAVIVMNLLADVLYRILDPRVRAA